MKKSRSSSWSAVLPTLLLPVLVGLALYVGLFTLIQRQVITHETLLRYIAGHPVSQVTTAMFLIGLAALLLAAKNIFDQYSTLGAISLAKRSRKDDSAADSESADHQPGDESNASRAQRYLDRLVQLPSRFHPHYLWRRLDSALGHIKRNDSAEHLDDELKYLSEADADEKHDRYALVRILIWATPMLGFLGTVLGISEALGNIAVGPDNNFQEMMSGLRSSLYVAFDTTALALTFSIVLMFIQFLNDRFETQLLHSVDGRARQELISHFDVAGLDKDPLLRSVERAGRKMLKSSEQLVAKQIELWRHSIESAQAAWVENNTKAHEVIQQNLSQAVTAAVEQLGESINRTISQTDQQLARRWEQWQVAFSENARLMCDQQEHLSHTGSKMADVMDKIKDISFAQKQISDYLEALPNTDHFADASANLSTAVRLLEYRLTGIDPEPTQVEDKKRAA